MRILFFIVHPAKFLMFRNTINELKKRGHTVDWVIPSKFTLEDLTKKEGWEYTNLFPEGRLTKGLPLLVSAALNMIKTVFRLFKYTKGKKYDLFISSDMLSFVGWVKGVPTLIFQDDDFKVVPEYSPIWLFATKVYTPEGCDLGPFRYKQVTYKSSHKWAYCNPKYFKPDKNAIKKFNPKLKPYSLIRLVSLTASHDHGNVGFSDDRVRKLVDVLEKKGNVYILYEREIRKDLEKYKYLIKDPYEYLQALHFAQIVIGDGQSTVSEAGLLGTPAIRFNKLKNKIGVLNKEHNVYGLNYAYDVDEFDQMMAKVKEILSMKNAKEVWKKKVERYSKDHIDSTEFYINLIESYDKKGKKLKR